MPFPAESSFRACSESDDYQAAWAYAAAQCWHIVTVTVCGRMGGSIRKRSSLRIELHTRGFGIQVVGGYQTMH
ncbi:MAG: hypothetical protein ACRDUS_19490 [Mycobacterium sp.]